MDKTHQVDGLGALCRRKQLEVEAYEQDYSSLPLPAPYHGSPWRHPQIAELHPR